MPPVSDRRPTRAITFDVGNTLLFPHPSVGHVYSRAAARHGITMTADEAEIQFFRAWNATAAAHQGLIYGTTHDGAKRYWDRVITARFGSAPPPQPGVIKAIIDDLYEEFSSTSCWRLHSAWSQVRQCCRDGGLRLGLISNWDLRLRRLLEKIGIVEDVDAVVISAEHAVEKPDPGIFYLALQQLDVTPGECLHVGDAWREDVQGASHVGMHAAWYSPKDPNRPEPGHPSLVIRDLSDLLAIIPRLSAGHLPCGDS